MRSIAAATITSANTRTRTVPSSLAVSIALHFVGVTLLLAMAARGGLTPRPQPADVQPPAAIGALTLIDTIEHLDALEKPVPSPAVRETVTVRTFGSSP
jgi:hypothetical protein